MSKKARRRRVQQQRSSTAPTLVQTEAPVAPLPEKPAAPDFQEYRYVVTDLRRVGILAAAMFALLIALSFVIH